jgi:hypothetical protein
MHGLSATSDQLSDIVIQFREWSATLAFRRVLCASAQSLIIICSHRELYKLHAAVHKDSMISPAVVWRVQA